MKVGLEMFSRLSELRISDHPYRPCFNEVQRNSDCELNAKIMKVGLEMFSRPSELRISDPPYRPCFNEVQRKQRLYMKKKRPDFGRGV